MVPLEGARGRVGMEGEPGIPSDRGLRMKLARPREEPIVRRRVVGGGGQADSPTTTTTLLRLRRNVVRVVARLCFALSPGLGSYGSGSRQCPSKRPCGHTVVG